MKNYDCIIIGGGIGGLVSGCYLTKYGFKVLLIEKNQELGGYCQSVRKDGFIFTSCIRGFVGCKEGGVFDIVLNELSLKRELRLVRPKVYDLIRFNNY